MKLIITNLKHFIFTFMVLLAIMIAIGIQIGAEAHWGRDRLAYKIGEEGPHIFYEQGEMVAHTIKGSDKEGFYIDRKALKAGELRAEVYFPLDSSRFTFEVEDIVHKPDVTYQDGEAILAISDIEGAYGTFRDFLIAHHVIDQNLNWTFGRGHLVLLGDFVDRGFSTTQVLWFIYKLEQEAKKHGGKVHYILGNHEIKNLQGNFQSAAKKYHYIAGYIGKQQYDLYGDDSVIGRWLASKNTVEKINGYLFMHGGLHPSVTGLNLSLRQINEAVRAKYRQIYYPSSNPLDTDILISTTKGPSWYRGYFKGELNQDDVDMSLEYFQAKAVVVGHTIQDEVSAHYAGKVMAIDVKHPLDYRPSFPFRSSQGLLLKGGKSYRLLSDGSSEEL